MARFGIDADRLDEGPLNLVIVTMESVRASELKASGHRAPYLPTLDRLAAEGLYAERAFSTSLQSSEATFAVNCGYYPLSTGRPFFGFKPALLHARCLPEILVGQGYSTSHYIGCDSAFEGEGEFLRSHGMARVTDEKDFPKSAERFTWKGRAVSDGELFARAGRDAASLPQPFLLSVTTMTSHGPFDLPPEVSAGLDAGEGFGGDYLKYRKVLAYLDRELGKFIAALSSRPDFGRTIFLIYGDHGVMDPYPQGEDAVRLGLATASAPPADIDPDEKAKSQVPDRFSSRWNFAAGAHQRELADRVPVILWSPGGLIPAGRIRGSTAQIDFLPTLLDLLGIEAEGTFLGHSMFDLPEDRKIILGMGGPHAVQGNTRCWTTERMCIDVDPSFDADLYGTFRAAPADPQRSKALREWARQAEEASAILGRRNQLFPAPPPAPAAGSLGAQRPDD